MKKAIFILFILISGQVAAQEKPEAFSKAFVNCLLNYKEACGKQFITTDTLKQEAALHQLQSLYSGMIKPNLKGKTLSSSTRAVLKDSDTKSTEFADIFITIIADNTTHYELSLWGCYSLNGKWFLGDKIEMKKMR